MTLLTPKQAAEFAAVSEKTVLRDIAAGRLRARRIGARWRIDPADLERWGLEENTPKVGEVFDFPGGTIEASTSESKGANRGENPRPRRHQPVRHQAAP
jgi:excisionase family DNA binding protein